MMSTTFHLVVIASHPSYTVINHLQLSFSGCCGSYLEQSTTARHIRAVTASLLQSPQDTSLQALLPVTMLLCLRSDLSFSDTLIVFVTYLLLHFEGLKHTTTDSHALSVACALQVELWSLSWSLSLSSTVANYLVLLTTV